MNDEYTSSVIGHANEGGTVRDRKKRCLSSDQEGDDDAVDDPPNPTKKLRFVWTPDRHQQFLNAVIHLGIDSKKAVPRKILELMNVPGLTREIVASHLQKFRLHLKKQSDEMHRVNGMPNENTKSNFSAFRRSSMQALTNDAGHYVSPQTQASVLHTGVTSYLASNAKSRENHIAPFMRPSMQEPNHSHAQEAFGISKYDSNIAKNFPQPLMGVDDALSSGYGPWEWPPSNAIGSVGIVQNDNVNVLTNIMQHQMQEDQQKNQQLQLQRPLMHDLIYSDPTRIQPSYFMGPSQPYETLQVGISPATNSVNNYNNSIGRNSSIDDHNTFFPPQLNNSLGTIAELCGYTATNPISVSPPMLCSRTHQLHNGATRPFSGPVLSSDALFPYGSGSIDSPVHHQGQVSIESYSDINSMKEQPNFINGAQVDHSL